MDKCLIEREIAGAHCADTLAEGFAMRWRTRLRRFKLATGRLPGAYAQSIRIETAKTVLQREHVGYDAWRLRLVTRMSRSSRRCLNERPAWRRVNTRTFRRHGCAPPRRRGAGKSVTIAIFHVHTRQTYVICAPLRRRVVKTLKITANIATPVAYRGERKDVDARREFAA